MAETTAPETREFQAEVRQVLDIVVNSLYTDRDIFVRELVSNASDALEKLRHEQLKGAALLDEHLPLEVNISTDDQSGTLTIQDFGIGMDRESLIENLGTIAHSGSKAFLEALKAAGQNNESLIGQFGVGFYSVFMVAEEVRVYTRAFAPGSQGWLWTSDGSGQYQIEPSDGQRRGTKIVIKLKEDCKEFAQAERVKGILKRYSSFVQFPVNLNGEKVNRIEAIWLRNPPDVSEEDYKEFYKFQANAFDEPRTWLHFVADAPIAIHALLYAPQTNTEKFGLGREEIHVGLYCRKILIDAQPKGLLPEWCRFVRGVVDSADLPLNISRETMQDSALVRKINQVLTKRLIKHLDGLSKKDPAKYKELFEEFGMFLKEGVATDEANREGLAKLLRFESSYGDAGEVTSLEDYLARAPENAEKIYYLSGTSRRAIETGPYLEAFKARGIEVLFLYEGVDEFVMHHLREFAGKKLVSADEADLELEAPDEQPEGEPLPEDQMKTLCEWFGKLLDKRVSAVEPSKRLVDSPAVALNNDKFMSARMRQVLRSMNPEEDFGHPTVRFELNPRHRLIHQIERVRQSDEASASGLARHLFDNALMAAGLLEDPRELVRRTYAILESAASGKPLVEALQDLPEASAEDGDGDGNGAEAKT